MIKIIRPVDKEKAIYLAEHDGEQIIVTPDGAPLDSNRELSPQNVSSWVVLNEDWEEIDLIKS